MNKTMIAARFERAIATYHHSSTVQRQVAEHLFGALSEFCPKGGEVLEVGCGSGHLSRLIVGELNPRRATLNDLSPKMEQCVGDILTPDRSVHFVAGDAETTDFDAPFDLIASASTLQWFENPTLFMTRMASMLNPQGVIAISSFDSHNLYEVSSFTGLTLPYPPLELLVDDNYRIIYQHSSTVVLQFESPIDVLRHLRATGVNSLDANPWSRHKFAAFCNHYNEKYSVNGAVKLTYTPTYLIARKK